MVQNEPAVRPPKNRVNYLILGDGYTEKTVETTLKSHIETMLERLDSGLRRYI
jgi:hypothetical protein